MGLGFAFGIVGLANDEAHCVVVGFVYVFPLGLNFFVVFGWWCMVFCGVLSAFWVI